MNVVYLATEHPTRQRRTTDRYHRSTYNGRTAACSPDISLAANTAFLETDIPATAPRRLCGNCARINTRTLPHLDPDPTRRRNPRLVYRSPSSNAFHAPAPAPTPALTAACRSDITLDETTYARAYDTTADYPYRNQHGQAIYAARMCTACADIYPGMLRRYTFLPATADTADTDLHAVATSAADTPTALCTGITLIAPDDPTRLDLPAHRIQDLNPTVYLPNPKPVLCTTCLAILRTRTRTRTRTPTQKGDS